MLEELQRRNYAQSTVKAYLRIVQEFAKHFHQPPDKLGPEHLRQYQAYLLSERKLQPRTARLHVCALRFFFRKTLKRRLSPDDLPYPKAPRRLPTILTTTSLGTRCTARARRRVGSTTSRMSRSVACFSITSIT